MHIQCNTITLYTKSWYVLHLFILAVNSGNLHTHTTDYKYNYLAAQQTDSVVLIFRVCLVFIVSFVLLQQSYGRGQPTYTLFWYKNRVIFQKREYLTGLYWCVHWAVGACIDVDVHCALSIGKTNNFDNGFMCVLFGWIASNDMANIKHNKNWLMIFIWRHKH